MTKRQHYVPQFYLRNFCDGTGALWIYDKQEEKFFYCTPKDICQGKFLYESRWENANPVLKKFILPNTIEREYSQKEGEYAALLKKLIQICEDPENRTALVCNSGEKAILASFVANMLVRNPWSIHQLETGEDVASLKNDNELCIYNELFEQLGLGGFDSFLKGAIKNTFLRENIEGSIPPKIAEDIRNMNFVFVKTTKEFVTASFPLIYLIKDISEEKSVLDWLFIPITPQLAVFYSSRKVPSRNHLIEVTDKFVDERNSKFFNMPCSEARFVISRDENLLRSFV